MESDHISVSRKSGLGGESSSADRDSSTSIVPTMMGEEAADTVRAMVPSQAGTLTGVDLGNTEGSQQQAIVQAIRTLQVQLAEMAGTLDIPQMDDISLRNPHERDDQSTEGSVHSVMNSELLREVGHC